MDLFLLLVSFSEMKREFVSPYGAYCGLKSLGGI